MVEPCSICVRMERERQRGMPYLINEFTHSYFIVGDSQYLRGYCLLVLKRHVRELHELEEAELAGLNAELMAATRAIVKTFNPWKMNHCCLGNTDEHIHWHLFPRYESDPDHRSQPFKNSDLWKDNLISPDDAKALSALIRPNLASDF